MRSAPSALLYLCARSVQNHVLTRLRRLKQPKYLIGFLFALGYIYFIFVFPQRARSARRAERIANGEIPLLPRDFSDEFTAIAGIVLLLLFIVLWLWPRGRTVLQFSEAEIAWLFPGPVAHSSLVHFSLLRTQATLVISAVVIGLFTAGWTVVQSPLWARMLGWWLVIGTFALHATASGFMLTRLRDRGWNFWQRELVVLALFGALLWLLNAVDPHLRMPMPRETALPENFFAYLLEQIASGAIYWLVLPLRLLAAPLAATDAAEFLRAVVPALGVYGLHYYWAFLSEVPDREAAMAGAEKRARMAADMRQGKFLLTPRRSRKDPFKLVERGSPVTALLWKNLLSAPGYMNLRTWGICAAVIVLWNFTLAERAGPFALVPTALAAFLGAQMLFIGSLLTRHDLRNDLENADLIKTWPLPGWQIVFGEMLAPVIFITGLLWLCLLQLALGAPVPPERLPLELRTSLALAFALVCPFICATQVLIANAVTVMFPAWAKATSMSGHGWEHAAPRLLFVAGAMLATFAALLPALLFGLLAYIPFSWFIGNTFALLPAALVVNLVLAAELAWGINWVGERFDAYDLSA